MSAEAWTVVGVIVGAVIGGAAQVVAESIRHHNDRKTTQRTEGRDAYARFLEAVRQFNGEIIKIRGAARQRGVTPAEISSVEFPELHPSLVEMSVALGLVELVAPKRVHDAARQVHLCTMDLLSEKGLELEGQSGLESMRSALRSFVRLAKEDMNVA